MDFNPFKKRATEYLDEQDAFLPLVTPEPVQFFLKSHGVAGTLFDRLVLIYGSPGSGKTTMGRLFELPSVVALIRNIETGNFKELTRHLQECGLLDGSLPRFLGARLPLETDYREFWDFPYDESEKTALLQGMIEARTVLSWIRNLEIAGCDIDAINIETYGQREGAIDVLGGTTAADLRERAREVESKIYAIVAAIVPPPIQQIAETLKRPFRPFDVISAFDVPNTFTSDGERVRLTPLVILDDAHVLHPRQVEFLRRWLVKRELRIGRWILSRFDVLQPDEALNVASNENRPQSDLPGVTASREITEILIQSGSEGGRGDYRRRFRKMARDMARRYLSLMPLFNERGFTRLDDLLEAESAPLSDAQLREVVETRDRFVVKNNVGADQIERMTELVNQYFLNKNALPELKEASLRILIHRYMKRTPQRELWDDENIEPSKPLKMDKSIVEAARLHLFHKYSSSFYFGVDTLCDAASENAEQFLKLADALVDASQNQMIRKRSPQISARDQTKILRSKSTEVIEKWNFPECNQVKRLVTNIGERCLHISLQGNAPLGAGANAYGILTSEFKMLASTDHRLARILHFGLAYKAINLVSDYNCKGKSWCIFELGGYVALHHGLTLQRGGFIEGSVRELESWID